MSTFPLTLFAGRRFAVVGLGRNGLPVAHALAAMGAGVAVWDDKPEARAAAGLPLLDLADGLAGFEALVLSPGIPHRLLRSSAPSVPAPHPAALAAQRAGLPILSDAELLFQAVRALGSRARFVGITGTNGKSTTTALLANILSTAGVESAAGGNLGVPALALPALTDAGVYVLEMSSYMLERLTTLRFDAAALLNLSPDHLDRHGDMAGYVAAKRRVFDRQDANDIAVIGTDDHAAAGLAYSLHGPRVLTVSGQHSADVWCDDGALRDGDGPILPMDEAPALPGAHNAQNAAAAAALALALGVPRAAVANGIAGFQGLPHRQQRVAVADGVAWINDSKATNADAAARALACYDRLVWIAGGIAKAGGIESLGPLLPRVAHAVLIGRDAPLLAATLADAGVPFTLAGTLDAAVPAARAAATRTNSPVVLLSPACASFDQFVSFEARGERFRDLVLVPAMQRSA
jgi:UDP-N-acetylmuramoylalanine--D-glutamate ligase